MTSRIIAIGDIHGCYYTLMNILEKIEYDKNKDTIIFLGDYIDRGKHSYEVVSYLISLQKEVGKDKCICLLGNHEDMALSDEYNWIRNGGKHTKKSYYKNSKPWSCHFWWFRTLPVYYETDNFIFCHAGLTYPRVEDNTREELLWGRDWITRNGVPNSKTVVFGHTPLNIFSHYTTMNESICIDAGCVFGGRLCAMVIDDDNLSYVYEPKSELD